MDLQRLGAVQDTEAEMEPGPAAKTRSQRHEHLPRALVSQVDDDVHVSQRAVGQSQRNRHQTQARTESRRPSNGCVSTVSKPVPSGSTTMWTEHRFVARVGFTQVGKLTCAEASGYRILDLDASVRCQPNMRRSLSVYRFPAVPIYPRTL